MQIVYRAAHSVDAQLVRNLLAQEGIQAFVFGAALEAGAGDLPAGGTVRLEVADQEAARARSIIEEWQATAVPPSEDDEEPTDSDFGDDDAPEHVEDGNAYRPLNQRKPRSAGAGTAAIVVALVIGALLGAAATAIAMQPNTSEEHADYNDDGIADERLIYEGEKLVRVESDRNIDGKPDMVIEYDARGLPTISRQDADFNDSYETEETYRDGLWAGRSVDYDGDGAPEHQQIARRGVLAVEEWLDGQGRVIKRNFYTGGRLTGGEIDSDGNGELDTSRLYDARGEIQSSGPRQAP